MAQYTMTILDVMETLTGQPKHVDYPNIMPLINQARPLIFDFDYPLFDPSYKPHLETIFLQSYLFREICDTPIRRWQIYLQTKMQQEMPVLNKYYESELLKFDPLTNFKTLREGNRDGNETLASNTSDKFQGTKDTDRTDSSNRTNTGNTENLSKQSDTPQSQIDDLLDGKYLSSASHDTGKNTDDTVEDSSATIRDTQSDDRTITRDDNRHSLDTYFENFSGYQGVSPVSLLQELRNSFINVDNMFIRRMSPLFFKLL